VLKVITEEKNVASFWNPGRTKDGALKSVEFWKETNEQVQNSEKIRRESTHWNFYHKLNNV